MNAKLRETYASVRARHDWIPAARALEMARQECATARAHLFRNRLWSDEWDTVKLGGGYSVRATLKYDDHSDAPWENQECFAVPIESPRDQWDMVDGELSGHLRIEARRDVWFYPFSDALAKARQEQRKYGCKQGRAEIEARALAAVRAEYEFFRRYFREDWCYVGVVVELLDGDGETVGEDSLWGIESDSTEYILETANDMARTLIADSGMRFRRAATLETE